jgi:hypothetical protein
VQTGEVIRAMTAEAGFAVQVNAMEFGAAIATAQRGDYVMTQGGWSGLRAPIATRGASCIQVARSTVRDIPTRRSTNCSTVRER